MCSLFTDLLFSLVSRHPERERVSFSQGPNHQGHTPGHLPPLGTKIEAIPYPGTQTSPFHKKTEILITFYKIDVDSNGSCKGQETSLPLFLGMVTVGIEPYDVRR